jgi:predicted DsbA family dithiol-disulfide isomerase
MADLHVTEFTDPGCPWAWSAEPLRRKLLWQLGDAIAWSRRMVVLASDPQEYVDKGFTPDKLSAAFVSIGRQHGMPMDSSLRERMAATEPACRAVVAARVHDPASEDPLLRALRVRHFAGEPLDEDATVRNAADDAGVDPDALAGWMAAPETDALLAEDMHAARHPTPAALAQNDRLAGWEQGRRYTCPSLELARLSDGAQLSVPGFQPFMAYEVAFANLLPDAPRRPAPDGVEEVLAWAGEPLATREVAVVCEIDHDEARQRLGRVATEQHLGADGLWTLG